MSMVGTFDAFTSARLGIYAAQHGLRTTGNNISNINTDRYTRQRVDQYSFKVGANDMYRSFYDNHVGAGALVQGISQVRDPYLDIRYRNISTETYHNDTWLAGLQNIASILDEVGRGPNDGDGLLYAQLQDLAEKLRSFGANPTDLNDRLVRNSATSLTALFHNAANRLESLYNETKKEFDEDLKAVNETLRNIRDLNKSIREAEIHGDTALEMRDERNRQIDKLSQYLDIRVEYSYENVGAGVQVEKLTISLNNKNPDSNVHTDESVLVDGVFATQLSVPEERPVLNTYGKEYAYLKDFTYLKKIPVEDEDAFMQYLQENGFLPGDSDPDTDSGFNAFIPLTTTDEKGNIYFLVGTNDPDVDGIYTEKNDNLTIQLSPLVNSKGELWKNTTTRVEEVTGIIGPKYATYKYGITIAEDALNNGNLTFNIDLDNNGVIDDNDITCTIPLNRTSSTEDILAYIAEKLDASGKYPGYKITAKDDQLIFTATTPGSYDNGDEGVPDKPKFAVEYPPGSTTNQWITAEKEPEFSDGSLPNFESTTEYDEHGNVIQTVNYAQGNDGKWYRIQLDTEYTHTITLDDNDLRGILQAEREMLTEEGEFASEMDLAIDENALIKRGIPYYMKSLDLLAQKFAEAYNKLNSGYAYNQNGNYIKESGEEILIEEYVYDENGDKVLDENNVPTTVLKAVSTEGLTVEQMRYMIENNPNFSDYFLKDENGDLLDANGKYILNDDGKRINVEDLYVPEDGVEGAEMVLDEAILSKVTAAVDMNSVLEKNDGYFMGGVLFSNRGDNSDPTGITAANISIAADWSNGVYGLIPTFMMLFADDGSGGLTHSTQSDNANHMIAMIENPLTYDPRDLFGSDAIGPVLFQGSFNDMLSNMMAVQGEDADITNVKLSTYAISLTDLEYSREGVSGVDLNDEAMNMITYQKAMSAAMRLMTAIDEMLDRLINNTGLAGR